MLDARQKLAIRICNFSTIDSSFRILSHISRYEGTDYERTSVTVQSLSDGASTQAFTYVWLSKNRAALGGPWDYEAFLKSGFVDLHANPDM